MVRNVRACVRGCPRARIRGCIRARVHEYVCEQLTFHLTFCLVPFQCCLNVGIDKELKWSCSFFILCSFFMEQAVLEKGGRRFLCQTGIFVEIWN